MHTHTREQEGQLYQDSYNLHVVATIITNVKSNSVQLFLFIYLFSFILLHLFILHYERSQYVFRVTIYTLDIPITWKLD